LPFGEKQFQGGKEVRQVDGAGLGRFQPRGEPPNGLKEAFGDLLKGGEMERTRQIGKGGVFVGVVVARFQN
jgi:hypothetical protein